MIDSAQKLVDLLASDPLPEDVSGLHTTATNLRTRLYLAVRILRELSASESEYRLAYLTRSVRRELRDQLLPLVRNTVGTGPLIEWDEAAFVTLSEWLIRTESDRIRSYAMARLVAECLERINPALFWDELRRYYNMHESNPAALEASASLRQGDPVPVCDSIFGGKGHQGTRPRNLPRWRSPDRLTKFVLAPAGISKFQVSLSFTLQDELALLQPGGRRIATIHPTAGIEEYIWTSDQPVGTLRDVRPRHESDDPAGPTTDIYAQRLTDGIDVAFGNNTRLVVLPELALTEPMTERVVEHWQAKLAEAGPADNSAPALLVAGSHHTSNVDGSILRNLSTIVGRSHRMTVEKAVPYIHRLSDASHDSDSAAEDERDSWVEAIDIHRLPPVTIYCGREVTLIIFVCMDFLLDDLRDLARDLDIGLVVVPSMSLKSQIFHGLIAGHVAGTQAAVVFANSFLSTDDQARGAVGFPGYPQNVLRLDVELDAATQAGPGVAIVDIDHPDSSEWIPIEVA